MRSLSLNKILEEFMGSNGIDFFGVADLSSTKDFIESMGGELVSKYPKSISIGIRLLNSIVDELPRRHEESVSVSYRRLYDETNQCLNILTGELQSLLQEKGHEAFKVPASERHDDVNIAAIFSHKLAAHQSGLGWIGKSCLLINPEAGPRIRWGTVLTDAPVEVTGEPLEVQCGDCTDCVNICPVDAFTGKDFHEDEPREVRYDAQKCQEYLGHGDEWNVCGLCVYICPYGRE
ncbi:MAG TPA: 4Fe-4S dicluster domain-containing protein [Methanobacterium sp.]|jgi:epoxyqueuosine reductase QueG|nr:MAG: epoxyqueuosine reductase [Methanobacterium sp.]HPX78507.1 4Fe-4S dicluster domain-containing protein [Methanobacterium sp.]